MEERISLFSIESEPREIVDSKVAMVDENVLAGRKILAELDNRLMR